MGSHGSADQISTTAPHQQRRAVSPQVAAKLTELMVFFGHWWGTEHRAQLIERIGPVRQLQAGFERPVFIYNIVAKGTVDRTVLDSHESKISVQDALMAAAKRAVAE